MTEGVKHYRKKHEYDKPLLNNLVMNINQKGLSMDEKNHYSLKTRQDGITILFEFPKEKKKEECTINEIKNILTSVLREYLTNIS